MSDDVTARVAAELALRRNQALFRAVIEKSAEAVSLTTADGHTEYLSHSATRLLGWSAAELALLSPREQVLADDRATVEAALISQLRDGVRDIDLEFRANHRDGSIHWIAVSSINLLDDPDVSAIVALYRDVTARKNSDEAVRASEERYRRIVESTSEGVWMYDSNNVTTFMNTCMAKMLGHTPDQVVGLSIFTFIDERNQEVARARVAQRRIGIDDRQDFELMRRDGTSFVASLQANSLFDSAGNFEGVLALVRDVSPKHRAEESRTRLAAIVESSDDAIISKDLTGKITSWNHGAEVLFQYSADEVIGEQISLLDVPDTVDVEHDTSERLALGEAARNQETRRRAKDGSIVEISLTRSPLHDEDGVVTGVSWIARDLTTRRKAEENLRRTEENFRQAQKMEAVGRLAGGIAHDFNNLLSVILSYSEIARDDLKVGDPLRVDLGEIHTAGLRAAELTKQLLAFSRKQVLQPRVVDLNQILNGMERMLSRLLGDDVELTVMNGADIGRVLADPGQIEQVIMNLAVNARDAMPDGGMVTIETSNVEFDDSSVGDRFGTLPGHYVLLAVSDTGMGMDAETKTRIFEPFFTTKEQGKGTGLGLSTVIGIVQQSGGTVGVYSELDRGSTFKVYLPRTDKPAEAPRSIVGPDVLQGTETILLVEDEDQVRNVACMILRRHGYHVLDASNGGEAFLIAKDFSATIHLLLTDVVMPRLSGRKLAEQLAPQRPDMKVLFISGYTDDAIIHHGVLDAGVAFLQKPFKPDALVRKVRQVLDSVALRAGAR